MWGRSILVSISLAGCTFPYEVGTSSADGGIAYATLEAASGSCADLPDGAVIACGTCGRIECVAGSYGPCVEPMNAPGSACGTCGTSSYSCRAAGTVECGKVDDRTAGADYSYPLPAGDGPDTRSVTRRNQLAVTYAAKHTGDITGVKLVLRRTAYNPCGSVAMPPHPDPACGKCAGEPLGGYTCALTTPVSPGSVTVDVFAGAPDMLTMGMPLATTKITLDKIADVSATSFVELPLPTPLAVKAGDPLAFVVSTDSTSYALVITGARLEKVSGPTMTAHQTWTRTVYPPGAWSPFSRGATLFEVSMLGCL